MSDIHGLTAENLLAALPQVLQEDESMHALAASIADLLTSRQNEIDLMRIYAVIDRLPEDMLDILAYDFKVDWWDGDYTIEEKRQTLKDSWRVHRMLGTKAAVEAAISAIYPATQVQEWFEYGGEPYFFKLLIDLTDVLPNPEGHERVLNRVSYYKNLRSHIEEIQYIIRSHYDAYARMGGCMSAIVCLPIMEIEDSFQWESTARFGGLLATQHRQPIPERSDDISFSGTERIGGAASTRHSMPIPEACDALQFKNSMRAGGRTMTYSFLPVPEIKT